MIRLFAVAALAGTLWGQSFRFSSEAERPRIWGGGPPVPRSFFPGELPALFARTLELDGAVPAGSTLEWIFTGDEGGFTVRIAPGRVRVTQRYYDSYGHSQAKPPKARYHPMAPGLLVVQPGEILTLTSVPLGGVQL